MRTIEDVVSPLMDQENKVPNFKEPLDQRLHAIVLEHLAKIDAYIPGPVKKAGGTREQLLKKYAADPLYSIFGLDSNEYVGATFGGGMITSIHRKLGDIYEGCVRVILMDKLAQTPDQVVYSTPIMSGEKQENRTADGYLQFDRLQPKARKRVEAYCQKELKKLTRDPKVTLIGVGMEVRHCYQTGDSKRTQADEAMARHFLVSGILPVMPLFCNQSNPSIVQRYRSVWVIKEGMESYDMVKIFTTYDFHDFLFRNRDDFRGPVIRLLRSITQ